MSFERGKFVDNEGYPNHRCNGGGCIFVWLARNLEVLAMYGQIIFITNIKLLFSYLFGSKCFIYVQLHAGFLKTRHFFSCQFFMPLHHSVLKLPMIIPVYILLIQVWIIGLVIHNILTTIIHSTSELMDKSANRSTALELAWIWAVWLVRCRLTIIHWNLYWLHAFRFNGQCKYALDFLIEVLKLMHVAWNRY